jgi:hypothetical protein
MELEEG